MIIKEGGPVTSPTGVIIVSLLKDILKNYDLRVTPFEQPVDKRQQEDVGWNKDIVTTNNDVWISHQTTGTKVTLKRLEWSGIRVTSY